MAVVNADEAGGEAAEYVNVKDVHDLPPNTRVQRIVDGDTMRWRAWPALPAPVFCSLIKRLVREHWSGCVIGCGGNMRPLCVPPQGAARLGRMREYRYIDKCIYIYRCVFF